MRDVIVIGSGGGGAVVAKELAAQGLDVLLLEAGANEPDLEEDWTHFEADANSPASGFLRFGPADRSERPWRRETPQTTLLSQVSGVGGTTRHYFANSPRAMPGAFLGYQGPDDNAYDVLHRFPFSYSELIPYYRWVEETLPVEAAPMGTKEQVFFLGARRLGLPVQTTKDILGDAFRPQENAILQPGGIAGKKHAIFPDGDTDVRHKLHFPAAQGCTFCGHCISGCYMPLRAPRNLKAKRSTNVSYIPMALTADLWTSSKAITLVSDAFAAKIHTAITPSGPAARGVTWRVGSTGELVTEEARVVVMAAGSVESPRLWLNSGLPDPFGRVGRGLTDHHPDGVVGVFPFDTNTSRGPGSLARADFPGRGSIEPIGGSPGSFAGLGLGLSDGAIAGAYNFSPASARGADAVGRHIGPTLKAVMSDIDRILFILVLTDDDVEDQNRVVLSDTAPPDEHGPIPRVVLNPRSRSARTAANREFLVGKAVELLRAAGAIQVFRTGWAPFLFHIHSTMRMGLDPATSVLDANAESRWVKRLFIADNSALANCVGGPNPTLTTQALATRTAEKIFQIYFGGRPWVRRESPTSSIDPAVTKAVLRLGL
jgi:choline dehydrogenase-like flavoprotein